MCWPSGLRTAGVTTSCPKPTQQTQRMTTPISLDPETASQLPFLTHAWNHHGPSTGEDGEATCRPSAARGCFCCVMRLTALISLDPETVSLFSNLHGIRAGPAQGRMGKLPAGRRQPGAASAASCAPAGGPTGPLLQHPPLPGRSAWPAAGHSTACPHKQPGQGLRPACSPCVTEVKQPGRSAWPAAGHSTACRTHDFISGLKAYKCKAECLGARLGLLQGMQVPAQLRNRVQGSAVTDAKLDVRVLCLCDERSTGLRALCWACCRAFHCLHTRKARSRAQAHVLCLRVDRSGAAWAHCWACWPAHSPACHDSDSDPGLKAHRCTAGRQDALLV